PVLLLSEQALASRICTIVPPDLSKVKTVNRALATPEEREAGFLRYKDTETGVSAMSIPGMSKGVYTTTGIEHDESGDPGYTPKLAMQMKRKRFRKMETCLRERGADFVRYWGEEGDAEDGVIA